jgi:hypothetical protein
MAIRVKEVWSKSGLDQQFKQIGANWYTISTMTKRFACTNLPSANDWETIFEKVLKLPDIPKVGEVWSQAHKITTGPTKARIVSVIPTMQGTACYVDVVISDDPTLDPEFDPNPRAWSIQTKVRTIQSFVDLHGNPILVAKPLIKDENVERELAKHYLKKASAPQQIPMLYLTRRVIVPDIQRKVAKYYCGKINRYDFLGYPAGSWLCVAANDRPYNILPPGEGYRPKVELFEIEYQIATPGPIDLMTRIQGAFIPGGGGDMDYGGKMPWDSLVYWIQGGQPLLLDTGKKPRTKVNDGSKAENRGAEEIIVRLYKRADFEGMGTAKNFFSKTDMILDWNRP